MTTTRSSEGGQLVPAGRSVPMVGETPELRSWAEELVARARSEGVDLTGESGLLTAMVRQVLQTGLDIEMVSMSAMNPMPRRVAARGTTATAATPRRC